MFRAWGGGAQCCETTRAASAGPATRDGAGARPFTTLQEWGWKGEPARGRTDGRQRVGLDMFGLLERRHRDSDKGTQPTAFRFATRRPITVAAATPRCSSRRPRSNAGRPGPSPKAASSRSSNHLLKCEDDGRCGRLT